MRDAPSISALRVSGLPQRGQTAFNIRPESSDLTQIAQKLDLLALRKLSFEGTVSASGSADWQLKGKLGATVVQPCAVTLEPVTTRIDMPVSRLYVQNYVEPETTEIEMPDDETVEALTAWIDPSAVMLEALDLALPMYPRSDGAELGMVSVSEPGVKPMTDEDAKPFAGLAALKAKLEEDSPDDDTSN